MKVWVITVGLLVASVSGCGTSSTDESQVPAPSSVTTASTTEVTPVTAADTTTAATEPELDLVEAAVVWSEVLVAGAAGDPVSNTSPEVADQLSALFVHPKRELISTPVVEVSGDTTVDINDCVVLSSPLSAAPSVWFRGTATHNNNTWTIDDLQVQQLNGCVPASVADKAIAAYEAYWDARTQFFDPPDPDHPLIAETTTGGHRNTMTDLATQFVNDGQVMRGRAVTNPEVWQYGPTDFIVLIDCHPTDPERGVYDAASGERTDVIPPITPGQVDLLQTTLLLENGTWRVSDIAANRRSTNCTPAPSPNGLPVVGGSR